MYYRDRQSVFLSLFFPLMMMFALGYMVSADVHPPAVALVGDATAAPNLVETLESSPLIPSNRPMTPTPARRSRPVRSP